MAVPPEPDAPTLRRTRNPNYRSTIYKDKHRRWVGRITMGIRDTTKAATVLLIAPALLTDATAATAILTTTH